MAEAAQPKNEPEDSPLSPWWVRSVLIVLVFGLVALLAITLLASRNAPPIPGQVKDASGATVFTADDISNGQALFLGRSLRADEPRWLVPVINLLFAAFVVVIGASLLGEWTRMSGLLGKWWFWFGDQGWGMLAIALMVFVLRQTTDDARWPVIEKYIRVGFWGTNIGLLMMVALSLFPGGVLQVWDVVQHGYWHARMPGLYRHPCRPPDRVAASPWRPGVHHLRRDAIGYRRNQSLHRRARDTRILRSESLF